MKTGEVWGTNSFMIMIDGERYMLGEIKTDGIEKGDIVEYEHDDNHWISHLSVVAKAGDRAAAAAGKPSANSPAATAPQSPPADEKKPRPTAKKGAAAKAATPPADAAETRQTCKFGKCPDSKDHFVLNKRRDRWECDQCGMDNPNLSKCPLNKGGFTSPPTEQTTNREVTGIYVTHDKLSIALRIDGSNCAYSADPALVKYLDSDESKVKPEASVKILLENRGGKGFVATSIGPGPDLQGGEQPPVVTGKKEQQTPSGAAAATIPTFRKAVRKSAKLRVGLCGTAGSGKTMTALLLAFGIGGRIAVIDTENSSAELYAHLGNYDVCILQAPFTAQKYTDAIHAAEREGYDVIILDSITHAWAGEGGLLDLKDQITRNSRSGNSFTAWKDVTPLHRGFVEAMLQSRCHIIATMRSKTEYVIDTDDRGKSFPRKIGMAPIQREGMDYEFTLVFDLDANHIASASKDRTSLFTGKSFMPSVETGRQLKSWLDGGTPGGA